MQNILYDQILLFLLPGLTQNEKRIILPLLFASLILFGLGLIFSYYALIPAALNFFLNYSDEVIEPFWSFDEYFEFILVLFYSTGFAFQIPIILVTLVKFRLVSLKSIRKNRPFLIVIAFIFGAIFTPPDIISQILLALPMIFLFELGIIFSKKIKID